MIELIKIEDNYAKPNPNIMALDEFRSLVSRDRGSEGDSQGRKKLQATKELSWIYFMFDPLSPYQALEEEERYEKVGSAVFKDPKFKPDATIQKAVDRYKEMTDTIQARLLRAAKEGSFTVIKYLNSVDLTDEDEKGKPKHKVNDVIRALEKIGEVTDSLEKLEERVLKAREKDIEARGGVKINKYSE